MINQPSLDPLFKQIWQVEASPKVQHFLWKCLSNCISVAGNLSHRHLSKEASCIRCPSCTETVNHMLFKCSYARLVWAVSPIPAPSGGEWSDSIYHNLFQALNMNQDHPNMNCGSKVIPWLLWRLWKSRNDLIYKGKDYNAAEVVRKALEDEEEWRTSREEQPHPPAIPQTGNLMAKWKHPPHSWVKCNSDGAWNADRANCGIGWVLRNSNKEVLWMGARAIPRVKSVLEAETEALRWAILNASRFNYTKVIFESDSQQLVSMLRQGTHGPILAPLIQDIEQLLQHFTEVKVEYVCRKANGVADRIAKESISFLNHVPKLYSIVPSWAKHYVDLDKL